jgi:hypothetical protein
LSVEGKFSCCKSARNLNNISHDKLTRILSKATLKEEIDIKNLPIGGELIFDDTSINKSHSKNIEYTSFVWCSSISKAIRGLCFIKIIYIYRNKIYNLADIFWRKGGKTKNELIRDCLKELYDNGLKPKIVLFDCFYAACKNLNLIDSFGWNYLTLCKSNKIFERQQVKMFKYFGGNSLYGKARGIYHKVQIAKHCNRYIMTNLKKPIKSHSGWLIYKNRWFIETIFRDLKTTLHLEDCSSRSLKAQINHVQACMEAYIYLKENYSDKSIESAHELYLREFRSQKPNKNYDSLLVA